MDREGLLSQMRQGRQELEEVLSHVPDGKMTRPVLPNGWSVKDMLAHIGFWERRAAELYSYFRSGQAIDPKPGTMSTEELNQRVYDTNRWLALGEMIEFEKISYNALYRLAATVPEADLFDPQRFPATEGNPFYEWIIANACGHYNDHLPDLRNWLCLPGWVAYHSRGKPFRAYTAFSPQGGPGVILLHAWWGLNPFFQNLANRLAAEGFTVFAPDLNNGKVASSVDEAKALLAQRDLRYQRAAAFSAVTQMRRLPGQRAGRLGVIGFSMGAPWSVMLSAKHAEDVAATVLFYGTETANLAKTRAAYLCHFGESDEYEPGEGVEQMKQALQSAGLETSFHTYPSAGHWFFEEDRPDAYRAEAANLAWERTLNFLRAKLAY
jgi:carboxymethylenebutenolidase